MSDKMSDFNPNSTDAVLSRILTAQEKMVEKMEANHTEIAGWTRAHEKFDNENQAKLEAGQVALGKQLASLQKFKWMAVGAVTFFAYIIEHGLRFITNSPPPKH